MAVIPPSDFWLAFLRLPVLAKPFCDRNEGNKLSRVRSPSTEVRPGGGHQEVIRSYIRQGSFRPAWAVWHSISRGKKEYSGSRL